MTTSALMRFFTLRQSLERAPGRYAVPSRLAITPSSSWATVASSSACPSPIRCAGTAQFEPLPRISPRRRRRSSYGSAIVSRPSIDSTSNT